MELWDGYRKDGSLAGVDLVRGQPIPPDIYHIVCGALLRHDDGSYLLMLRHPDKPWGNRWEATAAGHSLKGEDPETCIRRELYEETGIHGEDFRLLDYRIVAGNGMFYTYLCRTDAPKDSVRLQEGETVGYRWLSEEEFRDFVRSGEILEGQMERCRAYFQEMGYL